MNQRRPAEPIPPRRPEAPAGAPLALTPTAFIAGLILALLLILGTRALLSGPATPAPAAMAIPTAPVIMATPTPVPSPTAMPTPTLAGAWLAAETDAYWTPEIGPVAATVPPGVALPITATCGGDWVQLQMPDWAQPLWIAAEAVRGAHDQIVPDLCP